MNAAITGVGIDLCRIGRIRRLIEVHGDRFLRKVLHPDEIAAMRDMAFPRRRVEFVAGRWAAKEAAVKAIGKRVPFPDMKITSTPAPALTVYDTIPVSSHVSISHDGDYATAICIVTASAARPPLDNHSADRRQNEITSKT
ncbi:4'-phosphopantetheinyl transferase superfamily [Plasmodiophora brassicae]